MRWKANMNLEYIFASIMKYGMVLNGVLIALGFYAIYNLVMRIFIFTSMIIGYILLEQIQLGLLKEKERQR